MTRFLRAIQSSWISVDLAALVLRGVLGVVFIAHGGQKLFSLFGGHGIDGTSAYFNSVGIPSSNVFAYVVGITEFFGGIFLIIGFLTVIAAIGLITDMAVAIAVVTYSFGFFSVAKTGYGWELNLVILGMAAALLIMGPGAWSLDALFRLTRGRKG